MAIAICTLFEGNYHHGVAALCNSLYKNGYRGKVYAGYRGNLPDWAYDATPIEWPGYEKQSVKVFDAAEGLKVYFIELQISSHLAHHKPDFMIGLLQGPANSFDGIFYFDPDIIVKCNWIFLDRWVQNGAAIIQEINGNIMPPNHPTRFLWAEVIKVAGDEVINQVQYYYNCGFCGVTKKNINFLRSWSKLISTAINKFDQNPWVLANHDKSSFFWSIDQDTFNMTVMSTKCRVCDMGPEAMDFIHGGFTMSHAVGSPKPWMKSFLLAALKGIPPSIPEKAFWDNVRGPILTLNLKTIRSKTVFIKIASFIGRFYRKF